MRISDNRKNETEAWLKEARSHVLEHNLAAAKDAVSRVLDRSPNHPAGIQLLAEIEAAEGLASSGLTSFFEVPREQLREKLTEALDILSDTYTQIRQELETSPKQNHRRHAIDEKVKIADIAAIKELLSKGEMDNAQLRLNLALLTFPEDTELKNLEETLLREHSQVKLAEDEKTNLIESVIRQAREFESRGQLDEAIRVLESSLATLPAEPRLVELCESLKRARERQVAEGVVERALHNVTTLESQGTLLALQNALQIVDESVRQAGDHPALSNVRSRLVKRITARQTELNVLLDQIEHQISGSEYRKCSEHLQNVFALDPSNSRARELQVQLKSARLHYLWQSYRKPAAVLIGTIGLAGAMLFLWPIMFQPPLLDAKLVVTSSPKNAKVFIDNGPKGSTPYEATWQIRRGETLRMAVRLELENYESFEQVLVLSPNQTETLTPTLTLTNKAAELQRLSDLAQQALQRGDLVTPPETSAVAYLKQITELDPAQSQRGSLADNLLNQIKASFKARLGQLNNQERNSEVELVLLEQYTTLASDDSDINSRLTALSQLVQRQKNQISAAIAAGVLLSSQAGQRRSALQLLSDLERRFPREKPSLKAKRDEIRAKVIEMALAKCGSPSAECSSFVEIALRNYPNDAELKSIPERAVAKVEPPPQPPQPPAQPPREAIELKSKLEEAFGAKRYVTPQNSSSVHYANELLKLVPDDSRASDLKQESRIRAEKDVEQLTLASQEQRILASEDEAVKVRSDFQHAKEILAGLRSFWPAETAFQRSQSQLEARSKDLEDFLLLKRTHFLIHDHAVGSCKGVFTISGYAVQYQPETGKDGFAASLADVTDLKRKDGGESLEFKIAKKTFTFKMDREIAKTGSIVIVENQLREAQAARRRLANK